MDWIDIDYLKSGNKRQQASYILLIETGIMSILKEYTPILVGTIPIGIDIPGSDLDIICNAQDMNSFREFVRDNFGMYRAFSDYVKEEVYIASFNYKNAEFEIFAKSENTIHQYGYRHMVIEDRILKIAGVEFKEEIISLKKRGYKTEPAFGELLNMENPYPGLLALESLSEVELRDFIDNKLPKKTK